MACKTALVCRWHISFCSQGEICQGTGHGKDHEFSGYRLELGEAARPTAGCKSVRSGGILRREDFTGIAGSRFSVASQKQHMIPADSLTKSVWTQSRKPCTIFTQKYLINDNCCYCFSFHIIGAVLVLAKIISELLPQILSLPVCLQYLL